MIKLIIIAIIILRLFFVLYFKIKYKFWSKQPVFHTYNIWYWLFPPGIIEHKAPKLGKFFDRSILTKRYTELSESQKSNIYKLIRSYYLREKDINYLPTKDSIFKYLQNHDSPSHISMAYKKKPIFDITNQKSIVTKELLSVITSRPLYCNLNDNETILNYVDFLCVHKNNRKKGTAPKIIYTHTSRIRNNSPSTFFLFKREDNVNLPIVPLTTYYTYGFDTKYWKYGSKPMGGFSHFLITSQSIHTFYHLIEKIKDNFSCTIYPSLSNMNTLIENNLINIYIVLEKDNPVACYVFRKPFTIYKREDKKGNSMDLIASFFDKKLNPEIFIYYFYFSLFLLQKKNPFIYFVIENISDNNYIIQNIFRKFTPVIKSPTAYYFYNFAVRPIISDNLFILH